MASFLATMLQKGKLTWATLESSTTYAKYGDAVLLILESRGYWVDSEGKCTPIPKENKK